MFAKQDHTSIELMTRLIRIVEYVDLVIDEFDEKSLMAIKSLAMGDSH